MIFTSQSGLLDRGRDEEWDRWYVGHLRAMVTVPGISSAQRFRTEAPGSPPSLALYTVASAAVFDDPYYLSVRGLGDWHAIVDRRFYRRNLFAGLESAPAVAEDERLLVADREQPEAGREPIELAWLECVGLDRSTPYRGLAVLAARDVPSLDPSVAVYRPVTPHLTDTSRHLEEDA